MSLEYIALRAAPYAREQCRLCMAPFPEFMRGMVESTWRRILCLPYCAIICHQCKQIIGWEHPRRYYGRDWKKFAELRMAVTSETPPFQHGHPSTRIDR